MTDQPTLDECLHQKCNSCGRTFGWHRVTPTGNSYCLVPTHNYEREVHWRRGTITDALLTHTPVKNLKRSPFSQALGKLVNSMLGSYVEASA